MAKAKKKSKSKAPRKIASHSGEEKLNGAKPPKKAAKPEGPERVEQKRHKQKLPCAIDAVMVALEADDLAKAVRAKEALREEKRNAIAGFRDRLAHLDERLGELATAVEQHTVSREVECIDYLVASSVITVRQDTLETVTERPATADELQEKIFGKIDKANAEAAARVGTREAGEDSKLLPALFHDEIREADAGRDPLDGAEDDDDPFLGSADSAAERD